MSVMVAMTVIAMQNAPTQLGTTRVLAMPGMKETALLVLVRLD